VQESVIRDVLTDHEIPVPVVGTVFIEVMNLSTERKAMAERAFRDDHVLAYVPTWLRANGDVAVAAVTDAALPRGVSFTGEPAPL